MPPSLRPIAVLILCALVLEAGEALRPAQNMQRTDGLGMRWDINANGEVNDGTADCFDTGMTLRVNGVNFACGQPKETADGAELVLDGSAGQLQATRRIALLPGGGLRYIEIIRNPGSKRVNVAVQVSGMLGNQAMMSLWSDGTAVGGPLPKTAVGAAMLAQQGDRRPAVLFIIGEAASGAAPSFQTPDQRQFTLGWQLAVPPGGQAAVLHCAIQRSGLVQGQVADAVRPIWKQRLLIAGKLPRETARLIQNFRLTGDDGPTLATVAALIDVLGIDRGGEDVLLADGGGARMSGAVSGKGLVLATAAGEVAIAQGELIASRSGPLGMHVYTRDGEIILATACTGQLQIATGGDVVLPFEPMKAAAMVLRGQPDDGKAPAGVAGYLATADGARLALVADDAVIPLATPWGAQSVPLKEVIGIDRVSDPRPAWRVRLDDGSRFDCLPAAGELRVSTRRSGAIAIPCPAITGYLRAGAAPDGDDHDPDERIAQPAVRLRDGNRLGGAPPGATLAVLGAIGAEGASALAVANLGEIAGSEEGGDLTIRLTDGSSLVGRLPEGVLTLRSGGRSWRVPAREIAAWRAGGWPPEPEAKTDAKADGKRTAAKPAPAGADASMEELTRRLAEAAAAGDRDQVRALRAAIAAARKTQGAGQAGSAGSASAAAGPATAAGGAP